MDCTFIKNNLFALTEKQLPATELALAKEHIAGCAACSVYVTSFSSIMEVIEKDRKTEPNPFLATRIFQKMESQGAVANHNIFLRIPRVLQPAIAVALILLAVLTGFFAGKQGKQLSQVPAYEKNLNEMKAQMFISELNDEDKTVELYK